MVLASKCKLRGLRPGEMNTGDIELGFRTCFSVHMESHIVLRLSYCRSASWRHSWLSRVGLGTLSLCNGGK